MDLKSSAKGVKRVFFLAKVHDAKMKRNVNLSLSFFFFFITWNDFKAILVQSLNTLFMNSAINIM